MSWHKTLSANLGRVRITLKLLSRDTDISSSCSSASTELFHVLRNDKTMAWRRGSSRPGRIQTCSISLMSYAIDDPPPLTKNIIDSSDHSGTSDNYLYRCVQFLKIGLYTIIIRNFINENWKYKEYKRKLK